MNNEWQTINLNTRCRVKLTEQGQKRYTQYWKEIASHMPTPEITKDPDGYSQWMLWELMNVFGPAMQMGVGNVPFEGNDIQLQARDTAMHQQLRRIRDE